MRGALVDSRRDRGEDRVEVLHDLVLTADHQAEAALEPEHTAARPDVDVVDARLRELLRAADVVVVVAVAAVDDDVVLRQQRDELLERRLDDGGRHHDPRRTWRRELGRELLERGRARRTFALECLHRVGAHVVDDALVPGLHETADEVRAHPAQSDHAQLHQSSSVERLVVGAIVGRAALAGKTQ